MRRRSTLFGLYAALALALVVADGHCRRIQASPFNAAQARALQSAIENVQAELNIPAVSAAVITADNLTWSGACGYADVENKTNSTTGTLFSIGSLTKTFISALTLKLVEAGALTLDDPIGHWLSGLPPTAERRIDPSITVRQLLNHTSGIASYTDRLLLWGLVSLFPERAWEQDDVLRCIGRPRFEPGASWAYSNSNYFLMGMIIQAASGMKTSEVLHREVLAPLGLERTFLDGQETVPFELARGYSRKLGTTVLAPLSVKRTANYTVAFTAGALVATATDVARFAHGVFAGTAISESSRQAMLDFVPTGVEADIGYGLGILEETYPGHGTIWRHDGAIQGYGARLLHIPATGITLAMQMNTDISNRGELTALTNALLVALDQAEVQ